MTGAILKIRSLTSKESYGLQIVAFLAVMDGETMVTLTRKGTIAEDTMISTLGEAEESQSTEGTDQVKDIFGWLATGGTILDLDAISGQMVAGISEEPITDGQRATTEELMALESGLTDVGQSESKITKKSQSLL